MHYNLGNAYTGIGQFDEAIRSYQKAIQLDDGPAIFHNNLGVAYRDTGDLARAMDSFSEAVKRDPEFSDACANLGYALTSADRHAEGIAALKKALLLQPSNQIALRKLPQALIDTGEWPEAFAYYVTAERHGLAWVDLYNDFGTALLWCGYTTKALERFSKAIELEPEFAQGHVNHAWTLILMKRFDDAIMSASRALELAPDLLLAKSILLLSKRSISDWVAIDSLEKSVLDEAIVSPEGIDPLLMMALRDDPEDQRVVARNNVRRFEGKGTVGPGRRRDSGERICVAYLSADFREHPVGVSIVQLLECHDRSQYEIIGVMLGAGDGGVVSARIIKACDTYIDASQMSESALVDALRALRVDIIVDLMGHTAGVRHNVLAARPAMQTISYLGYPGTIGVPHVDYILADRNVIPAELLGHYDEATIWLPHSYFPTDTSVTASTTSTSRRLAGLPEDAIVFCGFCNLFKLSPQLFATWMGILREVKGAVLWMQSTTESIRANLRQSAAAQGIDPDRLIFAERVASREEYLARLALADLFLDTWPYNAHSTARDALCSGLPVLTCEGRAFAARVAGSLLRTLGLEQLIVSGLQEYEERAIALANDAPGLSRIRQDLRVARQASPLFRTSQLCRNVESAYRQVVERRTNGLAPEHFAVTDCGQ
jgi:predicted O-linked N-acetylglucosamine transferase (SPINDLY family)